MTVRQEIHGYIDDISENKLLTLKPLLFALANDSIVIERNLSDEERTLLAQGMAEYDEYPERFVPLDNMQ